VFAALPSMVFLYVFADKIIDIMGGDLFAESTITMRILLPIVLIISLSNLIGIQILIPLGKEKLTMYSVMGGAVVNFTLNMLLIPIFARNGAAVASVIAESVVTLIQMIFTWQLVGKTFLSKGMLKYIGASLVMAIVAYAVSYLPIGNVFVMLFAAAGLTGAAYLLVLLLFKDEIVYDVIKKVAGRVGFIKKTV